MPCTIRLPVTKRQFRILVNLEPSVRDALLDDILTGIFKLFEDNDLVPGHGIMSKAIPHTVDIETKRRFDGMISGKYLGSSLRVASCVSAEDAIKSKFNGGKR